VLSAEIPGGTLTTPPDEQSPVITENQPPPSSSAKEDSNPRTGVTLGFTSLAVAGGVILVSRKKRKKDN
jgi:hypothetical protein